MSDNLPWKYSDPKAGPGALTRYEARRLRDERNRRRAAMIFAALLLIALAAAAIYHIVDFG